MKLFDGAQEPPACPPQTAPEGAQGVSATQPVLNTETSSYTPVDTSATRAPHSARSAVPATHAWQVCTAMRNLEPLICMSSPENALILITDAFPLSGRGKMLIFAKY